MLGIDTTGPSVGSYDVHYGNGSDVIEGFVDAGGAFGTINGPGSSTIGNAGISDTDQIVGYYNRMRIGGSGAAGGSLATVTVGGATTANAGQVVGAAKGYLGFVEIRGTFTTVRFPGAFTTTIDGTYDTGGTVSGDQGIAGGTSGSVEAASSLPSASSGAGIGLASVAVFGDWTSEGAGDAMSLGLLSVTKASQVPAARSPGSAGLLNDVVATVLPVVEGAGHGQVVGTAGANGVGGATNAITPVPEPASLVLLGMGLLGLRMIRRKAR